jgi:hypothetical protein
MGRHAAEMNVFNRTRIRCAKDRAHIKGTSDIIEHDCDGISSDLVAIL